MDALLIAMKELGIESAAYANGGKVSSAPSTSPNETGGQLPQHAVLQKYISLLRRGRRLRKYFPTQRRRFANGIFTAPAGAGIQSNGTYGELRQVRQPCPGLMRPPDAKTRLLQRQHLLQPQHELRGVRRDLPVSAGPPVGGASTSPAEFLAAGPRHPEHQRRVSYWVLQPIDSGGCHFNNAVKNIASKGFRQERRELPSSGPTIGGARCVWCDRPSSRMIWTVSSG